MIIKPEEMANAKILVIGDVMLDKYIFGGVSRISPEAPVPVLLAGRESETLGGAANVANNIAMLNAKCSLIGFVGHDQYRDTIKTMLSRIKVDDNLIATDINTTTKIRVVGEHQQIVRIDYEDLVHEANPSFDMLISLFNRKVKDADTIIISDYGKGVISPKVSQLVISTANQMGKATIVDPKGSDWSKYQNATIVTPNVKELAEVANRRVNNSDYEIISAGQEVRARYGLKYLVVTRSEKGVTILSEEGVTHIATKAKEVYDVSGAGDTVVATMACALAVGASIQNAVDIANAAAGVVVSKVGTVPITMDDLLHYLHAKREDSAIPLDRLVMLIDGYKKRGKRIVFTNGCFDILHRGHVDYLRKAKSLGDILVLGLNSDSSVKRLKGESRPINNEEDRAFVLAALDSVDYVVIFDEDTPKELLSHIKPDLLVKGGDYTPETVIGKEYAKEVAIIDFVDGYSTTRTIERMR